MTWTLPQLIFGIFGALCAATSLGLGVATVLVKLGWMGGDKTKAISSIDHTMQALGTELKSDIGEIKSDVREIRGTVGRQDVTLAVHGEQLTSLSKRLDDEFGRRRATG